MRRVSLREANQNVSSCIAEVEARERLVLLRRSKPTAKIIPDSASKRVDPNAKPREEMIAIMEKAVPMGGVPPTRNEMYER